MTNYLYNVTVGKACGMAESADGQDLFVINSV
jgi:hypothetical protein